MFLKFFHVECKGKEAFGPIHDLDHPMSVAHYDADFVIMPLFVFCNDLPAGTTRRNGLFQTEFSSKRIYRNGVHGCSGKMRLGIKQCHPFGAKA
jgi:hypothetical protein